jgi:transposase
MGAWAPVKMAMRRSHCSHSAQFKAKVALAAPRGDKALAEWALPFDVHPHQIVQWKQQAVENMATAFDEGTEAKVSEAELKELHAKIGQLTLENDFLERAFSKARWLNARRVNRA